MQSHVRIALAVAVTGLLVAVAAGSALAATRKHVVITTNSAALHKRVLATRSGLTLYSLSAERKGRFICTDSACLSFWHPLLVPKGTIPTGASNLGTIARPGSKGRQVTFRGAPLYTFYLDHKRGDAGGEGFKDVGTWHAASPGR
jgi:predicted lipoprotein with Yx(FWY)xxD motif